MPPIAIVFTAKEHTHASEDHHLSVSVPIVSNSGYAGLLPPQEQTQTDTNSNTSHKYKNT
jgi:hypothetical protein